MTHQINLRIQQPPSFDPAEVTRGIQRAMLRAGRMMLEAEARQLFPNDLYAQQCHVSGFAPLPEEFEIVDDAANLSPP